MREEQVFEVTAPMTFPVIADAEFAADVVSGDSSLRLEDEEEAAGAPVVTVPPNRRARPGEARAWFEEYLSRLTTDEFTEVCVLWPFGVNSRGYPCIAVDGVSKLVTRVVVERLVGCSIPLDDLVCHTCDTPRCVNPAHFFLADAAANNLDKCSKGRQARGEGNARSKLTAADVRAIRATSTRSYGEGVAFARRYGVDVSTIRDVLQRRSWKSVA